MNAIFIELSALFLCGQLGDVFVKGVLAHFKIRSNQFEQQVLLQFPAFEEH